MENRPPLLFRLQVDEVLRVAEPAGIGSIIGPPHLRYHLAHLWEGREDVPLVGGELLSFRKARAVGQSATRPDSAFIQVRQEFRANHPAKAQIDGSSQRNESHDSHHPTMLNGPAQPPPIALGQILHYIVTPFANSLGKNCRSQHRR